MPMREASSPASSAPAGARPVSFALPRGGDEGEAPVLSLVTGTVDRQASFERLLQSVLRNTPPVRWELLVSDGSSKPYNLKLPKQVTFIPDGGRPGFSKAINLACRAARGKYVVWLNDDCEVQPGWAAAAVYFMEHEPKVGIGAIYWCDHRPPWKIDRCWGIPYANFGILRKSLGDELGWFDESIGMYGSDTDLCFRVLDRGLAVAPVPGSRILHHREEDNFRWKNQANAKPDIERVKARWEPHLARLTDLCRRMPAELGRGASKTFVKLHLGCGSIYLDGYVNVDLFRQRMYLTQDRPDLVRKLLTVDADYYRHFSKESIQTMATPLPVAREGVCDVFSDIRDLANFYSDSAEEILARQVFEHLSIHEARRAISSFRRVLRPGGLLRLDVPDHEGTVAKLLETHDPFYFRHLYGSRRDEYGYHLMSYTKEGLTKLVEESGFLFQGEEPNIHFYPSFSLRFQKPEGAG